MSELIALADRVGQLSTAGLLGLWLLAFLNGWVYTRGYVRELKDANADLLDMSRKALEEDRAEVRQLRERVDKLTDELSYERRRDRDRL